MYGLRMAELEVYETAEFNFGNGLVLPILVHIKDVDDISDKLSVTSNNGYSYIYQLNEIDYALEKYFQFIDMSIISSEEFETGCDLVIDDTQLVKSVDYDEVNENLIFLTGKCIYNLVLNSHPSVSDKKIVEYKKLVNEITIKVVNRYIDKLKELVGYNDRDIYAPHDAFLSLRGAYGDGGSGKPYFRENGDKKSFQEYSLREKMAMNFYIARCNEKNKIQHEEMDKKRKTAERARKAKKGRGF